MGSGQTTRASSPSSEHQILKKNIGGEFQSSTPLLLFPKSGCYTHPPPRCWCSYCPLPTKLFLTKLATASLPLSLKKTAVVLSPSPSPSPQPSQADSNYCWPFYDADCYPAAATKVIIATGSHKQTEWQQEPQPAVHSTSPSCFCKAFYTWQIPVHSSRIHLHWFAFYNRADSPDLQLNPKQICPTAPSSAFCADSSN